MFKNRLRPSPGLALLCTMVMILLSGACQKLEPEVQGPLLEIDQSRFTDGIPSEYGRLVAAVPHSDGRWISFWFERPDKSIVGVWVDTRGGVVGNVIDIPRK